jgi:hypothetical protein
MDKLELINKANDLYPVGSIYIDPVFGKTEVKGKLRYFNYKHRGPTDVYKNDTITDGFGGAVYRDGIWAEILKEETT